jgi:chromosome segregation ATPase
MEEEFKLPPSGAHAQEAEPEASEPTLAELREKLGKEIEGVEEIGNRIDEILERKNKKSKQYKKCKKELQRLNKKLAELKREKERTEEKQVKSSDEPRDLQGEELALLRQENDEMKAELAALRAPVETRMPLRQAGGHRETMRAQIDHEAGEILRGFDERAPTVSDEQRDRRASSDTVRD